MPKKTYLIYSVITLHLCIIVFIVFGGWVALINDAVLQFHCVSFLYSIALVVFKLPCPLTQLELRLRKANGEKPQWTSFIDHYMATFIGLKPFNTTGWIMILMLIALINSYPYTSTFVRL